MKKVLYAFLCIGVWVCIPVIARAQLNANFFSENTAGCSPIVVQFTDLSTGNPTSWSWNLGNGTTSTLQNPSTVYVNPGSYTVTLTVSNGTSSNTKTATNYITVLPSPFVNFVVSDSTTACAPETVQFTNLSVSGSTGAATYLWDLGDGTTSANTNPTHTYSDPGNYTVTLVATNSNGCVSSLVKSQYVKTVLKPVANFTAVNNNSCSVPATVAFTNTSANGNSYFWNFGDGSTSTAANPTHTYAATGTYTVTLAAINALGCSDTLISSSFVNIGDLSTSFVPSATTTCTGNNISFTNTSVPGPGACTWHFGDGTTSTVTDPTHAYAAAGTYTVKLVVNYNNCSDSATGTITVNLGPADAFTANDTYNCSAPFTVQFTNATTGATGYLWEFGDGNTSTGTNPSNTYNATGNYNVTLIATAANGCTDTLTKPAYIKVNLPTASVIANPSQGCAPLTVSYTTALSPAVTPVSNSINFGDGTANATTASGSHIYVNPGTYVMTYTYTLPGGCTGTAQTTVIVSTPPVANFTLTPDTLCPGSSVTFTNTSTGATNYNWVFGDGGSSQQTNPIYTYNYSGNYTVVLTASNNGCNTTLAKQVVVNPPLANYYFTYNCANRLQVSFHDTSIGATSWLWSFGDGTTSALQDPVHTFPSYATYSVVLTVTNSATGCSNSRTENIRLFADPLTVFTVVNDTTCTGSGVSFTSISSTDIASIYFWTFGDGNASSTANSATTHIYTTAGS
jgi:PKD repeat protein